MRAWQKGNKQVNRRTVVGWRAGTVTTLLVLSTFAVLHAAQAAPSAPTGYAPARIGQPAAPAVCRPLGFSNNTYPVGNGPFGVAVDDFNGDGIADLVTANYNSNSVSVLLGNSNGTFQNAVNYPAGSNPSSVAGADLFGDRNDDLVVANRSTINVSYVQGNGDGTFFSPYSFDMGSDVYTAVVGDFNNDSNPDLVAVSGSVNDVALRLSDGIGDFAAATHTHVSGNPYEAAVGDFNRDGNADLVTANHGSSTVSVLLGNGTGLFQAPINFAVGTAPAAVTVADFNNDGNPDLVAANSTSNNVSVLLGNGDGLFQAAINVAVGSFPFAVAPGDFNNDGYADLVTANKTANNTSVLLGNGNGTFQTAINFAVGSGPYDVVVGDFNRDGKPDLVITNFDANTVSVLLNTCVTLTPTATPRPPSPTAVPSQTPGGSTATPQATGTPCAIQFSDVTDPTTYYYTAVYALACRGVISGYSDGTFRPFNNTTRAQMTKIVILAFNTPPATPPAGGTFADVTTGNTFYGLIEAAAAHGIISGYGCGGSNPQTGDPEPCDSAQRPYFRPSNFVTRGQLAKIVVSGAAYPLITPVQPTFSDVAAGNVFYRFIETAVCHSIISGYSDGTFRPTANAFRGQIVKIVYLSNTNPPGSCAP